MRFFVRLVSGQLEGVLPQPYFSLAKGEKAEKRKLGVAGDVHPYGDVKLISKDT